MTFSALNDLFVTELLPGKLYVYVDDQYQKLTQERGQAGLILLGQENVICRLNPHDVFMFLEGGPSVRWPLSDFYDIRVLTADGMLGWVCLFNDRRCRNLGDYTSPDL